MLNSENRYLFKFAWQSIRRNSGRSFFIGFSVSLAVVIAVWTVSFFDGINGQIERSVVETNTGFFQLQEDSYARTTDASSPRELTPDVQRLVGSPAVKAYSPELVLDANISTPEGAQALTVIGVDPDRFNRFLPVKDHLALGTFLADATGLEAVIGQELASRFKLAVGDQLVLNYQDHRGELRSELVTVGGVYDYNSRAFQKRHVYVRQPTWQALYLPAPTGKVLFNRICVMTEGLDAEEALKEEAKGQGLRLKSWKDLNPEMAVVLEFNDGMIRFFFLILGATILMTILTPVRMLWQERFRELKMMNTLGVSTAKFWKIGFFEVLLMIALSVAFSSLVLLAVIGVQAQTGVDFRLRGGGVAVERAGIVMPALIYPVLSAKQLLITFTFVAFVLATSYLWSIHGTLKRLGREP